MLRFDFRLTASTASVAGLPHQDDALEDDAVVRAAWLAALGPFHVSALHGTTRPPETRDRWSSEGALPAIASSNYLLAVHSLELSSAQGFPFTSRYLLCLYEPSVHLIILPGRI